MKMFYFFFFVISHLFIYLELILNIDWEIQTHSEQNFIILKYPKSNAKLNYKKKIVFKTNYWNQKNVNSNLSLGRK